ncbi:MAG: hypothetical protein Q8P88_02730 [Candidatus Jorgensenbacteria bacterium]|nr:hypothetical protein [Candidatus Jorgensenbacteria bacterium]
MRSANKRSKREGYIAIVASMVVTTLVGVVALVFSSSNFLGRYDTLALEEKEESRAFAEGCVAYARLRLAGNLAYGGNENVGIASSTCRIVSVTPQGGNFRIAASASVQGKTTNLTVTVAGNDLAILTQGETP